MIGRARTGTLLLLAALALTAAARAEAPRRVVLLERRGSSALDHEIVTRVRAELGAAGFEVSLLAAGDETAKQAVEESGYALEPASVLLVQRLEAGGAELWLSDRLLQKTVVLRLKEGDQAARVAVQAVELVRARLDELSLTRVPTAPAPPPAPPPPARETRGAHPSLAAGIGLLEGFQRGQRAFTPVLRLGVALPERWTGGVLAIDARGGFIGLGSAAEVRSSRGSASLRHTALELDAVVRFLPRGRVQPLVSLGGGFLSVDVAGTAPAPFRNRSERTLSGLVTTGAGLWLQPRRGIGLLVEGHLLSAWSKTVVRIAGEDAAEVAAPLLLLSAGVMVEF
jgi:hypothetical protein